MNSLVALPLVFAAAAISSPESALVRVMIEVNGLSANRGQVLIGVCTEKQFLTPRCAYQAVAKVGPGRAVQTSMKLPRGRYAVQAVYDLNGNFQMDSNALGIPLEPVGFSRNARSRQGPPRFADAAVNIDHPLKLIVTVR